MNDAIKKVASLKNVIVDVNVSQISGQGEFLGKISMNQYNPDKFIPNGGPVTLKGVSTSALGKTYDEAYVNAIAKAVELMGL